MSRKAFAGGVTDTSTDVTKMGEVGDRRQVGSRAYRLVYTAATQAEDAILYLDSTDTNLSSFQVQVCAASTDYPFGVNDTGASIASGTYFWAQVSGPWAANYTAFSTKADIGAESPLYLDADAVMGTTVATNTHAFGQSIASLTSVATDADDAGPYTVYLHCAGA